jgi:hypothetical protein
MPPSTIHGVLRASTEGRLLVAEHTGPFNTDYWLQAAKVIRPLIDELEAKGPFGILMVFKGDALSSLGAMEVIIERNRGYARTHPKCVGFAICAAPDVEGRGVMRTQAERYFAVLEAAPGTTGLFSDREAAATFLRDLVDTRGRSWP